MEKDGFFSEPIEFFLGHIPFIITDLITQLIKTKGQKSKILFNTELENDELDKLITELKFKRITNWSGFDNPATLSTSLMIYINSLFHDEPLITEDIQEYLLSTQIAESQSYLLLLRKILLKLYIGRFQTLSYLIDFLSKIHSLSGGQLFKMFSIPFFGKKSLNLNSSFFNQLFQLFLNNYSTIFRNSITKESFLTDEQIDLLICNHNKGESVKIIQKKGNLTPKLIDQDELERIINNDNSNIMNDTMIQHQSQKIKKKNNKVNSNGNFDSIQQNRSNLYKDTFTQTECTKFSFSDSFSFELKAKTKKEKKEASNSNNNKKENISLQIKKPFFFNSVKNTKNHSSADDFSDFESFHESSSKTNSESNSSSATSSTTSSYSFYSFSHHDLQLSKYSQNASSTIQIRDCIPNTADNIRINTNTKVKKNKKNRTLKDRSDTSDNFSYSENMANNNNCEKIPEPPIILDYLNSNRGRKKTNYAKNHNYNNYLYADNSSDNTTYNYSENRDNDKSDSQNGIEVKFDFYKNLVNTNSIEALPSAPMLDPALLTSPIFGDSSKFPQHCNQENCYKNEIDNFQSEQITNENTDEDENSKHVSFQYQNGPNNSKANQKNRAENNSSNSIDESESSLASSCKKEEEDKKEFSDNEEETKKDDNKSEKKSFLCKYFKRKNEKKKKKDAEKISKEKPHDEKKKSKADKANKKVKKDKKDKSDKKSKKK